MSKLSKKKQSEDMHIHIESAYKMLAEYLPTVYVSQVSEKLKKKGVENASSSMIRNVRNRTNYRNDILLALVEVATENKKDIQKIKKLIA